MKGVPLMHRAFISWILSEVTISSTGRARHWVVSHRLEFARLDCPIQFYLSGRLCCPTHTHTSFVILPVRLVFPRVSNRFLTDLGILQKGLFLCSTSSLFRILVILRIAIVSCCMSVLKCHVPHRY
jgi:hypothetical protein